MSALLRGVTSKHDWDFYCLNYFYSYTKTIKFEKHYKVCKNHDYCYVEMPNEDYKILKYNLVERSMKIPFIIYADLEPLLGKMCTCHNDPEKSSTTKINEHTPSCYLLFQCWFDLTKSELDYYRGKDYYNCHTGKYIGAAHNICNLGCKTPIEIPVVFHNGSTYDYPFITNELAKEG